MSCGMETGYHQLKPQKKTLAVNNAAVFITIMKMAVINQLLDLLMKNGTIFWNDAASRKSFGRYFRRQRRFDISFRNSANKNIAIKKTVHSLLFFENISQGDCHV